MRDEFSTRIPGTLYLKMIWLGYLVGFILLLVAILASWRALDQRADRLTWSRLVQLGSSDERIFSLAIVEDLPEPARRYFAHTIQPGTPLQTIADITMTGEIGLGSKEAPNYRPMQARQILAPPHGLVWKLKSGLISGSDGAMPESSWTRFWIAGLVPVVRANGVDHHRSAFGRVIAESAFWAPASLLPDRNVSWEPVDGDTARATVRYGAFEQAVQITVDASGAPRQVQIQRWSNANPDKEFREQSFGGNLSGFEWFGGYRLPTQVEGGNHIGTPDYFPFFRAKVTDIQFQ